MNTDEMKAALLAGAFPKASKTSAKARASAFPGPEDKTCGDCKHLARSLGYSKTFFKCGANRNRWTKGSGTDIRLKDPACARFEAE